MKMETYYINLIIKNIFINFNKKNLNMKYAKIVCALFFILIYSSYANAQIDAVKIANAKKAYEESDYKEALEELKLVSKTGQQSKLYLKYKGLSFYWLQQLDSSKKYLKKYLILDVNDNYAFEALTEVEKRLKWFAEAPPMQETINWLTSKINETAVTDDLYKYRYKVTNNKIILEEYHLVDNHLMSIKTLNLNDLWDVYFIKKTGFRKDHLSLSTYGKKINIESYTYDAKKNEVQKTNLLSLYFDFDAEPGLQNKMLKAFSNIALENVKNMPTETY